MTRIQRIKDYLKGWDNSIYRLNTEGAKFYGATFYSNTGWDGAFEWSEDDVRKWDYQVNLITGIIKRGNKVVGNIPLERRPKAIYTVSNCIGVALYAIDDERVLVGVNGLEPEWVETKYDDYGTRYLDWYGGIYIDDFIRV